MADFGLTPEGFNKKRQDDIIEDVNAGYKTAYGDNFNVDPETPEGQIIGVLSGALASLWDAADENYQCINPSSATGKCLSDVVQYNGITRKPALPSTVVLRLFGLIGTLIPSGAIISVNDTGEQFKTLVDAVIQAPSGSVDVNAASVKTGPIIGVLATIQTIFTPITGWASANNFSDAVLGSNIETDEELRLRRQNSITTNAISIFDAQIAAILALDGVSTLTLLENDTDSVDGDGLPPHSTEAIVQGGDDGEIALTIWNNKSTGIFTHSDGPGATTIAILDTQGISHDINLTRPEDKIINVIVNVTQIGGYPGNGDDLIKQNIVDYSQGFLVTGRGFNAGGDIINSELYTPVNLIPGHTIDSILIAIDPTVPVSSVDIAIAIREASLFQIANITVNS